MFKKAVHIDLMYTELPYEERFAAAKADGFNAVEFYIEGWEDKDLPRIKQLLDENGLVMSAATGATPYTMCDPLQRNDYINHIRKLVEACKVINCPMLMCHSNLLDPETNYAAKVLPYDYSDTRKVCAMYDVLKTIAPICAEAGVSVTLEPLSDLAHPGYFMHDFKICADIIRAVNEPNIKGLFDCYHMYIEEGNLSADLEKYIDVIGHVHVADAPGRHDPGTGDINYANVLKTLSKLPYDGYVAFEFYPIDGTPKAIEAINKVLKGLNVQ